MHARTARPAGGPVRARWWHDRRLRTTVLLAAAAVVLYPILTALHGAVYGTDVPTALLLGACAVCAPLIARRWPDAAIALFTVTAAVLPLLASAQSVGTAPWPWSVPMMIAFALVVAVITVQHGWLRGLVVFAAGSLAGIVVGMLRDDGGNNLIVTTSIIGAVYLGAVLLAGRLRVGEELSRERAVTAAEQARRQLVEERTRIARELHDVVAHSMSLIQVQASTARYRVSDLPENAAAEFDDIAASARGALTEMRRVLGVLRTADQSAELAPQRGIDDLPALVENARRAGAQVTLTRTIEGDISPAAQIAAYRIVQEALSNALRHAPGAAVAVDVVTRVDDLSLRVRNAPAATPGAPAGGHGLRGMSERATLLGGTLQAGPSVDGGWVVTAVLPRHPPIDPAQTAAAEGDS